MKETFISLDEIENRLAPASQDAEGPLNIAALRDSLAGKGGREYWRSLEEVADTPEFRAFVAKEFPPAALEETGGVSRRNFLRLMGASLALAGLTACIQRPRAGEQIVPYVRQPEEIIPGRSLYFASTLTLGGYGHGVLVESHMGRPIKVEGNPAHPASLGATDTMMQAAVLTLYDPDRSREVRRRGVTDEEPGVDMWERFYTDLASAADDTAMNLRILTDTLTSPSLIAQIREILERYPNAVWHQYDAAGLDNARMGAELAFGEPVGVVYDFSQADVILSLDADFLGVGPGKLHYTRAFTDRRRVAAQEVGDEVLSMNRLYSVESTPSLTGIMADHHYTVRPSLIETFARAVAGELGVAAGEGGGELPGTLSAWLEPLARDLAENAGRSLVVAGYDQPPIVHALAHAINETLGNVGTTVFYTDPVEAATSDRTSSGAASLRELTQAMEAGGVDALVMLGGDPAYTAPADVDFAGALANVPLSVHLGLFEDETAILSSWHVPMAHELESWGDARAFDGTASIIQPLIAPLYGGRSQHEVLAILLGDVGSSNYELVRAYWQGQVAEDFDGFWRRAVHDGVIEGSALAAREVSVQAGALDAPAAPVAIGTLEVVFKPDPNIWDGRYANNAWLQELPKPLTKLVWDNAAIVGPATAERLGVSATQMVTLSYRDRSLEAPVFILPGQPADTVTLHLGYGRTQTGRVGTGAGFNAYALRTADAPFFGPGLTLEPARGRQVLVTTQDHNNLSYGHSPAVIEEAGRAADRRHIVRHATLEEYREDRDVIHDMGHHIEGSLYPGYDYTSYAWGMAIDLNTCTGCNACVVACQSENNISVVGKDEVRRGREMHWIRIDRYFSGDMDQPHVYHQPMLCQHCENAPCEVVCPVAATVHSTEGLNDMVYNRCVGTRYCSNNCPYKVRRFNFFHYSRLEDDALDLFRNPNVTVRSRGVMEKCTYCVQRINRARIDAENQSRRIRDGDVIPACASACPGRAIVFGDINDPGSEVSRLKSTHLNYGVLTELNTWPRTSYLARLNNPNPEIEAYQPEQHLASRQQVERA
ncbi:MAG: TAT-variant-translocated molybdopterin oxidoreductase [Deinococcota bacterium]|nr:TAT-variant-translocated molybdopterin oxidoreductase [Deinococcota bacterium]